MPYRSIATPHGRIWYHPDRVREPAPELFDPERWRQGGCAKRADSGRGAAWIVGDGERRWVLRGYRRGGVPGRLIEDWYLYSGESRTRPAREWRVLAFLEAHDLPAPRPVAARYQRRGLIYRADILTEHLGGTRALSARLAERPLEQPGWRAIGHTIRMFHNAGVCHADLNAHNILLGPRGRVYLIDFDRARRRAPGAWRQRNLQRLARSLEKLSAERAPFHFRPPDWEALLAGYGTSPP